jgi:hypothetical protein
MVAVTDYIVRGRTRDEGWWEVRHTDRAKAEAHARTWEDQGLTEITINWVRFDRKGEEGPTQGA